MEKNITLTVRSKTIVEQCPLHWSSNTVDYITATFDLDEEWSECDVVKAVWSGRRSTIVTLLDANNTCVVPHEVLATVGKVNVNLTGTVYRDGEEFTRITTYPFNAITIDAMARVDGDETAPVTPSQFDQYVQAVKSETEKVTGMTAVAETLPTGSDATASYSDGVLTLGIPRGDKGDTGERGERGERGLTGDTGATGNGIESVTKTGSSGLVDTYTITFTDGTSITFTVTNGQDGSGAVESVNGKTGNVVLTASDIGLGNVDNTSDAEKPISRDVQNALDAKVSSVNGETPDTNGNVEIDATDIETSNGVAVKSVNGNPITITDALKDKAIGVTATLEPIQSGSGEPSPTNVRPISGRTKVEITNNGMAEVAVNLGQTIYGGTLNVSTGELTVDRAMVDLGTFDWIEGNHRFNTKTSLTNAVPAQLGICSAYKSDFGASNRTVDKAICVINGAGFVYIYDTSKENDATAFKTAMSGVQFCYELATPQTYQLTPAQLNLLTGTNIITTNVDDLSVRYYASDRTGTVEGSLAYLFEKIEEILAQI